MPNRFNVSFEIVRSCDETGDYITEDCGFVAEDIGLREAIRLVNETESTQCSQECIEADSWPISKEFPPRWITVYNSGDFITGRVENRSLHLPDNITGASAIRIARLMGIKTKA